MDTQQTNTDQPKVTTENKAMGIIELTSIINRYIQDIDKTMEELKAQREMYNDAFTNDKEYSEKDAEVKKINKEKMAIKQKIIKQPAVEAVALKMGELRDELKSMQEGLSGYLQEYQRVSGTNIIESDDGEIRQIIPMFKLVKRSSKE